MPDKITKFILNLSKKEQLFIKNIFNKIISLDLNGLDIKKLKGQKDNLYRCRIGKIRIIFLKGEKKGFIKGIGYRGNVYKN